MGKETGISWTDHTFNAFWGCTKVSPGCDHCYAESFDKRYGGDHWGKGKPRRTFGDKHWNEPLAWNYEAQVAGKIKRVFCGSMMDVMDDEAPEGQRERLWLLINRTPHLLWQLLTKRPHRYVRYLPAEGFKYPNVILGATTEEQKYYDVRIKHLNAGAAHLRAGIQGYEVQTFISYEPALGPITMQDREAPNWLIFGGETGAGRRPMEQRWAEDIKRECDQRGVAFWMKQMSAATPKQAAALIPAHLLIQNHPAC